MKHRIEDIELLRGLAVFFVVTYHASEALFTWSTPGMARFYSYFAGGFGVDLFFAISGFVIARDLLPRLSNESDKNSAFKIILAFWVRRAWRLWPSAWLWLLIPLAACIFFNQSGAFGTIRANYEATIVAVLHVANLRFAASFGSFEYGASFPYWSLSLEEQFYLLLPLLVMVTRRSLPYLLIALILIQIFSIRTPLTMMLRTDAIALGVLIAIWSSSLSYQNFQPTILKKYSGSILMLCAFLCMGALYSPVLKTVSIQPGLVAIISAILVWVASYDKDYLLPKSHIKDIFVWIGARSYAIYLIHIPIFFATRELWHRFSPSSSGFGDEYFWQFVITSSIFILFFSELNYRFIESPLRKKGKDFSRKIEASNASKSSN